MDGITVLIPTHNRAWCLSKAINSIKNQTYKAIAEIIVYDDGSTDNTKDVVLELIRNDSKGIPIRYVQSKENNGVAFARNRLLDLCLTPVACWQDSDDVSNIHRISIQQSFLSASHLIYSAFHIHQEPHFDEKINEKEHPRICKSKNSNFAHASGLFVVDKNIRFNEDLSIAEDVDWRLRMEQKQKAVYLRDILYYIRFHPYRLGVTKGIKK